MKTNFLSFLLALPLFLGAQKQDSVVIAGVGDIMFGTNYPSPSYLPPNDGKNLLDSVASYLKSATITFGNAEGTFLNEGGEVKSCSNPAVCYAFRQPVRYAQYFLQGGFDLISVANNHVGDFGETGRRSTAKTLSEAGLGFAGLLTHPYTIVERDGKKFGLVAFSPNGGTCDIKNIREAAKLVKKVDSLCDILIVSFHGGAEGSKHTHVTKNTEIFYGEDRGNVHAFSHAMIDAGADVVFGHGPHVTRAVEVYKNRFIAYSLGNFCTYGRFNLKGINGLAPIIKVMTNQKGEFMKADVISTRQIGEGIPVIDPTEGAFKQLEMLTNSDFPGHGLLFHNNQIRLK
ncbi:MAG: CapA family protein [Cytophagaceae bacterium]|jgi:hypothetical protein|nr:CapA family protein [Cytophagaceae bacterium]